MAELPQTIPQLVARAAERFGDCEAVVDGDVRLSFTEFAAAIDVAARALIASSIEAGDRIAIWAPNMYEWAVAALATHTVGGIVIPLNTRFKGAEAGYVIGAAKARLLFTVTDFLDTDYVELLRDASGTESLEEVLVLRGTVPDGCTAWGNFLTRADGVDPAGAGARAAAVHPDDLCDILFTSGTTGAPKGAMLFHSASIRAYETWSDVVGLREGDRYLVINPFFHSFGLKAGILACLLKGATLVPHPIFDVPSVMRRVAEERITMLPGPPAIFQTILNHPDLDTYDLSSLRLAVTGAAPITTQMIIAMRETLGFENVVTGYGLTEAHGIATMCRHDDDPETIAKTSGRAIPGVEVRLIDDDGKEVGVGEPGEVLVRGYNIMRGYLDNPEATAEAIDEDGWLHTGDIAVSDANGNLAITDRKKDMYIVGGFNAYPAEIERIMTAHAAVAQVAIVGVPDDRLGEVGKAFVVPTTGTEVDVDELIAWCREHMANYKVPRSVEVVDALPLNASNKVLKYDLRARS
ncbi:MAG TPA: FadD3 family acyl-CoA ligase [Acidimicrobiales bacterium]|jgi:acyl-CoA synthetase (AMP-forming)/AMP-acid ligase II|nr:FadD3 family acyl-CoA ligase [Acidimicrobiales bacterium]